MKQVIVNSLQLTNSEDPSMKVQIQFFSPSLVSNFLHVPLLIVFSSRMLQTMLSRVILLVRDPNESSPQLNFFVLSPTFEDLLQKGVNVQNENLLYNYTDVSSMNNSKNGRPFWAAKEIYPMTLQALIEVCFQLRSLVVNLSTSIGSFTFLSLSSFLTFIPIFVSNFHAPSR